MPRAVRRRRTALAFASGAGHGRRADASGDGDCRLQAVRRCRAGLSLKTPSPPGRYTCARESCSRGRRSNVAGYLRCSLTVRRGCRLDRQRSKSPATPMYMVRCSAVRAGARECVHARGFCACEGVGTRISLACTSEQKRPNATKHRIYARAMCSLCACARAQRGQACVCVCECARASASIFVRACACVAERLPASQLSGESGSGLERSATIARHTDISVLSDQQTNKQTNKQTNSQKAEPLAAPLPKAGGSHRHAKRGERTTPVSMQF